jgi:circadian clock protein KaiB
MRNASIVDSTDPANEGEDDKFVLHLYVTGASLNSLRAIANIKAICEEHLNGNYTLEVIDVHQEEALAAKEQLIALPMLIKRNPLPERRMIGDMSNTEKVLRGLGVTAF